MPAAKPKRARQGQSKGATNLNYVTYEVFQIFENLFETSKSSVKPQRKLFRRAARPFPRPSKDARASAPRQRASFALCARRASRARDRRRQRRRAGYRASRHPHESRHWSCDQTSSRLTGLAPHCRKAAKQAHAPLPQSGTIDLRPTTWLVPHYREAANWAYAPLPQSGKTGLRPTSLAPRCREVAKWACAPLPQSGKTGLRPTRLAPHYRKAAN